MIVTKPYVLAWQLRGSLEQWDAVERGDSPMNETRFINPFANYYTEWIDVVRDVDGKA